MEAFIAHRGGDVERCRRTVLYLYRIGRLFDSIDALRELRAALFAPDEQAGNIARRIAELEGTERRVEN